MDAGQHERAYCHQCHARDSWNEDALVCASCGSDFVEFFDEVDGYVGDDAYDFDHVYDSIYEMNARLEEDAHDPGMHGSDVHGSRLGDSENGVDVHGLLRVTATMHGGQVPDPDDDASMVWWADFLRMARGVIGEELDNGSRQGFPQASNHAARREAEGSRRAADPTDHMQRFMEDTRSAMDDITLGLAPAPVYYQAGQLRMGLAGAHNDSDNGRADLDVLLSQLMHGAPTDNGPRPAAAQAISALPDRKLSAAMVGDEGKAECSICLDDAALGSSVAELPCRHWFHRQCVAIWLAEHDTCPHCRQPLAAAPSAGVHDARHPSSSSSSGPADAVLRMLGFAMG